jgi:hypothetical protein
MKLGKEEILKFIEPRIGSFHKRRIDNLQKLELSKILKRKNPYLFRAKNLISAADLVKSLLDAHLSSQEEGIFGDFLEELAIFICNKAYHGRKSSAEGIDLEVEKNNTHYILSIKSGPNWGNSRQISKMKDDFIKAKRILRTSHSEKNIIAINGCCYGKDKNPDKGEYLKYCGQKFWEFISGDEKLYIEIIEPLGHKAKEKNEKFSEEYIRVINKFTLEFSEEYCSREGVILWEKLVKFNSSKN